VTILTTFIKFKQLWVGCRQPVAKTGIASIVSLIDKSTTA
jgi:hypothetical protein